VLDRGAGWLNDDSLPDLGNNGGATVDGAGVGCANDGIAGRPGHESRVTLSVSPKTVVFGLFIVIIHDWLSFNL
jgi:hypothetical protein